MSEKVAIVGSRWGYDQAHLASYLHELHRRHPETILVSGGAEGADTQAEETWRMFGGETWSYRPVKLKRGDGWSMERLIWPRNDDLKLPQTDIWPGFSVKTKTQALFLRNMYIACDVADRLVAFFRPGYSNGTQFTLELAQGRGIPTYSYVKEGMPHVPKWKQERDAA